MAAIESMSYHKDVTPQDGGVMLQEFVNNQPYVAT